MRTFPVEEKIGEIRRKLAANEIVVLTAPPGSGKTTCVSPALLDEEWLGGRKILMLEPRRLAARSAATFMAKKRGESVGGTVGYQVRLERKVSASTRIEVLTEGLLSQRILSDPELEGVGLVIFDEFHERSLACDLSFALAMDVRNALRDDLRIMVMSATLDVEELVAKIPMVSVVRAEGTMFPVETKYLPDSTIAGAISRARRETDGNILCFLPGEGEIRRAMESVPDAMPLYGALPKEAQDEIFVEDGRRKTILATSIAETSVTIPNITAVIDSGLMRISKFSATTGMSGLVTVALSMDRAEQRRGRAGRVRAGICYRLWREGESLTRPKRMLPEILDADLCSVVLSSVAWGALRRTDLPWLTEPPANAWNQAHDLLIMLGAINADGRLTPLGERMSQAPIHPRLSNMLINVESIGQLRRASIFAAIIEENAGRGETDIRKILDETECHPNLPWARRVNLLAKRFFDSVKHNFGKAGNCKTPGRIDVSPIQHGRMSVSPIQNGQDAHVTKNAPGVWNCLENKKQLYFPMDASDGALLALAYPDRVAKNRGSGSFKMVSGRGAFVDNSDPLSKSEYIVCCRLDDRLGDAKIFLACPISESEILSLFASPSKEGCPHKTKGDSPHKNVEMSPKLLGIMPYEERLCQWDKRNERVRRVILQKIGEITISEKPDLSEDTSGDSVNAMMEGIRAKGVANLPCWTKEALRLRSRLAFLHRVMGTVPAEKGTVPNEWPRVEDRDVLEILPKFLFGMIKWKDLEKLNLVGVLESLIVEAGKTRRELDKLAPERMMMPSGKYLIIHYEGDSPTVEAKLQDCFGMMETPKVAGTVPIVMTLLSPANRPIQITKDLAGFWKESYQLVRKEMRGRYPKHNWPENPLRDCPHKK